MPRYSVETLIQLSESDLVATPEFKFSKFERIDGGAVSGDGHRARRRSSNHHHQRPPPPVAIIPNHMLVTGKDNSPDENPRSGSDDESVGTPDPDEELTAHYLYQREQRQNRQRRKSQSSGGAPAVQLSYAAALAHTSTMGRQPLEGEPDSAVDEEEDSGWVSVSRDKPRKKSFSDRRARGSFSRWRRDSTE